MNALWTERHWDRFFSEHFSLIPSVSFNQCSICVQSSTINTILLNSTREEEKQKSKLHRYLTVHFWIQDKNYQELYLKIWLLPEVNTIRFDFNNHSTKVARKKIASCYEIHRSHIDMWIQMLNMALRNLWTLSIKLERTACWGVL
jgi:hypothetical protein